jgi:uncharacterized membrane protein HdeD (DUF308 family)
MNFNKNIILTLAMTTTSVVAFAPPNNARGSVQKQQAANTRAVVDFFPQPSSALFMSDNTADEMKKQLEKLEEKADEATKFLIVDTQNIQNELANNWGWIVASGIFTTFLGLLSFGAPIFATGVAYDTTVVAIAFTAVVNLVNAYKAENGQKLKYALSSPLYALLAYYMSTNPAEGLNIITLTIASVIAVEGFFETILAAKNENIQGRPWLFVSGIGSVAASVWLASTLPASSLFAPGAALGTRLTSSGSRKIATGLLGKEIADSRKN